MWSIQSLHQWNTIVARWNTLLWYLFSTCQCWMIGMRHLLDNTNLEQGNEGCPANRAIRGLISQAPKICTIGNFSFFPCQLYVLTLHTDSTSTNADTVVLWYLLSHLKMTANFTNLFPIDWQYTWKTTYTCKLHSLPHNRPYHRQVCLVFPLCFPSHKFLAGGN